MEALSAVIGKFRTWIGGVSSLVAFGIGIGVDRVFHVLFF